jgi:hypothetical protein
MTSLQYAAMLEASPKRHDSYLGGPGILQASLRRIRGTHSTADERSERGNEECDQYDALTPGAAILVPFLASPRNLSSGRKTRHVFRRPLAFASWPESKSLSQNHIQLT